MIFLLGCNHCISRMYTITGEEEKQEASGLSEESNHISSKNAGPSIV